MLIIILFIIVLNAVSIILMYRSLNNISSKEKLIYIAAGTVLMYFLISIIYWISTRNIEITEVSRTGKDLIIFLFVPINGIIVLPLFAKSYCKFKDNKLSSRVFRNRGIALGILLLIILIVECAYFENIQRQVEIMINEKNSKYYQIEQEALNMIAEANSIEEENINDINTNDTNLQSNLIEVETTNDITNGQTNENNTIEGNITDSIPENNENVVVDTLE